MLKVRIQILLMHVSHFSPRYTRLIRNMTGPLEVAQGWQPVDDSSNCLVRSLLYYSSTKLDQLSYIWASGSLFNEYREKF